MDLVIVGPSKNTDDRRSILLPGDGRFGPVRGAELPIDRREVELDRVHGELQASCDLRIGHSLRRELEDLDLAGREAIAGARAPGVRHAENAMDRPDAWLLINGLDASGSEVDRA